MKKSILLIFAMLLCSALVFAEVLFEDGFEGESAWTLTGEFEIGAPQGLGGEHGNPDPTSAFAGENVLGTDLTGLGAHAGDYEGNIPDTARYMATSPIIDCSGFVGIQLDFQCHLNVEDSRYDFARIEVTTDGETWEELWVNPSGTDQSITDSVWAGWTVDALAANNQSNVQFRFSIGPSDGSWYWSGWNIDDFKVIGSDPNDPPLPIAYIAPANESADVLEMGTLSWNASPTASGYKIYAGTDGGGEEYPGNIAEGADLGNVTSYDFTGLSYGTTYYWAIVPYNAGGDAEACPIWSFTVRDNPTITEFPWTESFENEGNAPLNWVNDADDNGYDWEFKTPGSYDTCQRVDHTFGDNAHYLAFLNDNSNENGAANLLTPPLNITELANPTLSFFYSIGYVETSTSDSRIIVDVYSNGTWNNEVVNLAMALPWTEATVDLSDYVSDDVMIRFSGLDGSGTNRDMAIDDVTVFSNSAVPGACASGVPEDAATDISLGTDLSWTSATGATGYKLYLGTDGEGTATPTNILNNEDLGNTISINLLSYGLQYSTTYYWQVVPYNTIGDATECPIWSFTTVPDPTITTLPWVEDFSIWEPAGWDLTGGTHSWTHYSNNGVDCAKANFWSINRNFDLHMTTPPIQLTTGCNLSFKWSKVAFSGNYGPDSVYIDVTTDNGLNWDTLWERTDSTFSSNDGAGNTSPGTFVLEFVSLADYDNSTVKIRFRGESGYGPDLFIDDVTVFSGAIPEFGMVEGLVTNAVTGDSLDGAILNFGIPEDRATTVTNADGNYSIELATGQYDVTCNAFGFNEFTGSVVVTADDTEIYNIQLNPLPADNNETPQTATEITIPVDAAPYVIMNEEEVDWYKFDAEANTPVKIFTEQINGSQLDAAAWLYGPHNADGSDVDPATYIAFSDDDHGNVQPEIEHLLADAGTYFLRVSYYNTTPVAEDRADYGDYSLTIEIMPGGSIEGIITDATTTNPIEGANVALGDMVQTTDINGHYLFEGITPGDYTLEITAAGYNVTNIDVTVESGATADGNAALTVFEGELYPAENAGGIVIEFNSAGILWDAPNPTLTGTVWDAQDTEGVTFTQIAQNYGPAAPTFDCMIAADFVLPISSTITDANFFMSTAPAYSGACSFEVKVFADDAGQPGDTPIHTTMTNAVAPDANSMYAVTFDTPAALTAGTYWLGFSINLDAQTIGSQGHSFLRATHDNNTPAYWINPDNGFNKGTDWIVVEDGDNVEYEVVYALISNPGTQTRRVVATNNKHKETSSLRTLDKPLIPQLNRYINNFEIRLNREFRSVSRELIGYNVYRDDVQINTELIEGTTFVERGLAPGNYVYTVTVVYPEGESDPTDPVNLTIGAVPEFAERWDTQSFDDNHWTFDPDQGNWHIVADQGLLAPCLRYEDSQDSMYSSSILTPQLDGTELNSVTLDYTLVLNNYSTETVENMSIEVFDGTDWNTVATHNNQADDIPTTMFTLDISDYAAGNTFQVRFRAHGTDNYNINYWLLDNIGINAPEALTNGIVSGAVRDAMTLQFVSGVTITVGDQQATTAANGTYSLEVPAGMYTLTAAKDGYVTYTQEDVEVTADNPTTVYISLIPNNMPGMVFGFVTNSSTSQPVSGVTVTASDVTVTTDNSGAYQLDLAPGTYDVSFTHAMYEPYTVSDVTVDPGGTHVLDAGLTALPLEFWNPNNLVAENSGYKDVTLGWSAPCNPEYLELSYDDGYVENWWATTPQTGDEHMGVVHTYDQDFTVKELKFYMQTDDVQSQNIHIKVSGLNDMFIPDFEDSLLHIDYTFTPVDTDPHWVSVPCEISLPGGSFFFISTRFDADNTYRIGGKGMEDGNHNYNLLSFDGGEGWQLSSDMMIHAVISVGDQPVRNASRVTVQQVKQRIAANRVLAPIVGYNIYRNGTLVNDTPISKTYYKDSGLDNGNYDYTVKAVYEGGELSDPTNVAAIEINDPGNYYPVTNFGADIEGDTNVRLTWEAPMGAGHLWYQLDDEGTGSGFPSVATQTELAADFVLNSATTLTGAKLKYFTNPDVSSTPQSFQIKFYQNTANNTPGAVYTTTATADTTSDDSVYEVRFTPPVFLAAGTYWLGSGMVAPAGGATPYWYIKPTAVNGTFAYRKSGTIWSVLHDSNDNQDYELCFALMGNTEGRDEVVVNNMPDENAEVVSNITRRVNNKNKEQLNKVVNPNHVNTTNTDRACFGYRIYRNDEMIQEINNWETVEYLDEDLEPDMYTYYVVAMYNDETPAVESMSSGDEVVMIFSPNTNPPTNFTGNHNTTTNNITFTWAAPLPGGGDSVSVIDEGFEYGFLPGNWINMDADMDNYSWEVHDDLEAHTGDYCLASASALMGVGMLNQDNFLVTPRIDLGTNGELRFWVAAENALRVGEYFNVWISTGAPSVAELEANLLYSDTLDTTTYEEVVIDLSAYANQTVYIAWEHCDVYNMYYLKLDDISVTSDNTTRFAEDFETTNTVRTAPYKGKEHNFATRDIQEYRLYRNGDVIWSGLVTAAIDRNVPTGEYSYWVTAVYDSGLESSPSESLVFIGTEDIPGLDYVTGLNGNYPNPFNPVTIIDYSVEKEGPVTIDIYNLKGQKVKTLVNEANHKAGEKFQTIWNGTNDASKSVSSGVYFYRMKAGRYTSTKKMILMK